MRVLLVQPPIEHMLDTLLPRFVEEEAGYYPPLGLLYVAAGVRAAPPPGLELAVIDGIAQGLSHEQLIDRLERERPDIVGITATTFTLIDAILCARKVKERLPGCLVVLGGPHVTLYPEETASLPCVDVAVAGEAEESFARLVRAHAAGESLHGLPGTCIRTDSGALVNGPTAAAPQDLDRLPFPARDLLDADDYYSIHGKQQRMTTMLTSRGCPYDCSFCYHSMGKRFRARTPTDVVDEMQLLAEAGVHEVFVFDDTFTVNKKRVAAICRELIRRKLEIKVAWDVRARTDTVDEPLLALLREAGCDRISFGLEAGSQDSLRRLKKRLKLDRATQVIELARDYGFTTYADFILGNPGEEAWHLRRTIQLACSLPLDYCQFAVLTPYPATELYRQGRAEGVLPPHDYWREFARDPQPGFAPPLWEEHLDRDELYEWLDVAYQRFYLRPRFIWRRLKRLRRPEDLRRDARAALRMVGL